MVVGAFLLLFFEKRQNKKRYPLNHYVKQEYLHGKLSLVLKDPNLEIDPDPAFTEISTIEHRNGIKALVWYLKTSPQLHCPLCGFIMSKNGFKLVQIKHDYTSDHLNILSIKKQKYICSNCRKRILIAFKNSFFTMNYKKATNPDIGLAA